MRLGTRGSQLALWQAREVARAILTAGGPACEIVVVRTSGDEAGSPAAGNQHLPAGNRQSAAGNREAGSDWKPGAGNRQPEDEVNVKRLFVKELEDALLDGRIDIAVHSSKDLPSDLPPGLVVAATLPREDPRDAILLRENVPRGQAGVMQALGASPVIGTTSIRRIAQLRSMFPRASFVSLRGNVDTRLRKLDRGNCDALVLAVAGLRRLGLDSRISHALSVDQCVPAPGQGIIAVECLSDRADLVAALAAVSDADSAAAFGAEQAVVRALGGNCRMPIGALAEVAGDDLRIRAVVLTPDGSHSVRCDIRGTRARAVATGEAAARDLLAGGAREVLAAWTTT
jgi:hydroxymethylbilane synthase